MSDQDLDLLDEDDDTLVEVSHELYDTSDVEFGIHQKSRKEIFLRVKSNSDFNLIRFYLALRDYVDKIEAELNVMPEHWEQH